MAIVQNAPSGGIVVLPTVGPPGVSIVGPRGDQGEAGPEGRQGRTGDQGPAGAGALISRTATVTIAPWTAIIADGIGGCRPADPSNPAQRQQVIAITANGGATNAIVQGQNTGDLFGPNAGFVPGTTLFVGQGGALTATLPTSGWRQAVASVIADGHIVVALGEAALIATDVPLISASGFSSPASAADLAAGQDLGRFLTSGVLAPTLAASLAGVVPASLPPRRAQFLLALEARQAGSIQALSDALPASPADPVAVAWFHTVGVTPASRLATWAKSVLGLTDAQLAATISAARSIQD